MMNTTPSSTNQRRPQWLVAFIFALVAILTGVWLQGKEAQKEGIVLQNLDPNPSSKSISVDEEPISDQECSCATDITDTTKDLSFASTLGLEGNVSDCCCSFVDIERANLETVHPLLQQIVATPFFSHFKIDLCSDCKLWDDAPLCILRDCGVCECDEPPQWAHEVEWMPKSGPDCEHMDDQVVTTVDHHVEQDWTADPMSFLDHNLGGNTIQEEAHDNSNMDDTERSKAVVVDLRLNPERYTGYAGQSAEKVWNTIHTDNCFQADPTEEICTLTPDQRVYNRIISGLHSSISLHIAHSYCMEVDPDRSWECKIWGPNTTLAHERVLDHPDRLENLYVAFAMVLRAVQKAGAAVTAAVPAEDAFFSESLLEWTESLLPELTKLEHKCPVTFDESSLFEGSDDHDSKTKRLELQRRFRYLQQIMECVGCDRCKLWGTLQSLGIGTALRVLLSDYEDDGATLDLSRQEAVALVHTLERLSSSLVYANELQMKESIDKPH